MSLPKTSKTGLPRHNNALIRSGEAWLVGWSRSMLYSRFNNLPRSVFWSVDFNGRSDNADVIRLIGINPLQFNENPYTAPNASDSVGSDKKPSTRCPVCGDAISRLRLVFPATRCRTCERRICLRSTWVSSSLSTVTAVACAASLIFVEAPGGNGPAMLIGHAAVFLLLGTTWFHLFGQPALAGWFGKASHATLAKERAKYRNME